MRTLIALDFELGPLLELAIRRCVDSGDAFCVLDQRLSMRRRTEQLSFLGATEILDSSGRHDRPEGHQVDDDIGLVMLTSGSSGDPKAVELTWGALSSSAELTQRTLRTDTPPTWFPVLPPAHIGGLAVLLRSVLSDGVLLWADPADIESAPLLGATHIAVVRTLLARHDLSQFHRVLLGGAKPPGDLPENVVTTWGMTETGSGVVYNGVALPGVDVAGLDGELIVRSPTLFRSYRTSARPHVVGPDGLDGWFPTGDAGQVLDGRVSVRGRIGYVINTGGEKVWPEDVEAVILALDHVNDVAVTGVLDPEWGERLIALIVGDGTNIDDDVRSTTKEHIGPWAQPKEIRYVVAIPRTDNGKIRRSELKNLF